MKEIKLIDIETKTKNRSKGGFDKTKLFELSESIKIHGVLQAVIVRNIMTQANNGNIQIESGKYELIAGERRLKAAGMAGLETIPCNIIDCTDSELLEIQLIENLQREEIHPLDEAHGFIELIKCGNYDTFSMSDKVGKSVSYVRRRLRLNHLSEDIEKAFIENKIQFSHAYEISRLPEPQQGTALDFLEINKTATIKEFKDFIKANIFINLSFAPFSKNDIFQHAGPCNDCTKRTGHDPVLFEEYKDHESCLDKTCFNLKMDRHIKNLKEKGLKLVSTEFYSESPGVAAANRYEVWPDKYDDPDYEYTKPDKSNYIESVIAEGHDRGKIIYTKEINSAPETHDNSKKAADDKKELENKTAQLKVEALFTAIRTENIDTEIINRLFNIEIASALYLQYNSLIPITKKTFNISRMDQIATMEDLTLYNFVNAIIIERAVYDEGSQSRALFVESLGRELDVNFDQVSEEAKSELGTIKDHVSKI